MCTLHPKDLTGMSGQVRVLATGGHGGAGCESFIKRSRKGTFRPYLTVATVGKEGTSLWKLAYRKAFHQ